MHLYFFESPDLNGTEVLNLDRINYLSPASEKTFIDSGKKVYGFEVGYDGMQVSTGFIFIHGFKSLEEAQKVQADIVDRMKGIWGPAKRAMRLPL